MTSLTVSVPDERMTRLREVAAHCGLTPEELVSASIAELVSEPEDAFRRAADYVLRKNEELYRRLA